MILKSITTTDTHQNVDILIPMEYDQAKINSLLSDIEWLREDLIYLKDIVRSGNADKAKGKAKDFIRAFDQRIGNKV